MELKVTYKCGCTGTITIFNENEETVKYFMEKAASEFCPEHEKEFRNGNPDFHEKYFNLPELTGSPKQIAWARKIRVGLLRNVRNDITRSNSEDEKQALNQVMDYMKAVTESSKWINWSKVNMYDVYADAVANIMK